MSENKIIRASDPKSKSINVEKIKINQFVSPKKLSDQIAAAKQEYEELRKKIEDLYAKDGFEEGRRKGYEEGYQEGNDKGYQDGYQKGLEEGINRVYEEEGNVLKMFDEFVESLKSEQMSYINKTDEVVVDLVIEISKKILEVEAQTRPETILKITQKAMEKLTYCPKVVLHINPRDFEILETNREKMEKVLSGVTDLKIEENPLIALGSCKLETYSGVVDADFISQLDSVKELLKKSLTHYASQQEQPQPEEPPSTLTESPTPAAP